VNWHLWFSSIRLPFWSRHSGIDQSRPESSKKATLDRIKKNSIPPILTFLIFLPRITLSIIILIKNAKNPKAPMKNIKIDQSIISKLKFNINLPVELNDCSENATMLRLIPLIFNYYYLGADNVVG
jgi:hypothetical protein